MKKVIIILIIVFLFLFLLIDKNSENSSKIIQKYPWQITILPDGKSQVFAIVLNETTLKEVNAILNSTPKMALFDSDKKLSLEAYYKNVSLGGLIGSFILSLDATEETLKKIKEASIKDKKSGIKGAQYNLDKPTADKVQSFIVKNLIYIPTVQLDEEIIAKRFGKPEFKLPLKTKEAGWHYIYPEKGLDLIYKEEGKEILQYVIPKNINELLEPLQAH